MVLFRPNHTRTTRCKKITFYKNPKRSKDVESCLGILQSQFATIQNPCKLWQMDTIYQIMIICVIVHNMIIEDKRDNNLEPLFDPTNVGVG